MEALLPQVLEELHLHTARHSLLTNSQDISSSPTVEGHRKEGDTETFLLLASPPLPFPQILRPLSCQTLTCHPKTPAATPRPRPRPRVPRVQVPMTPSLLLLPPPSPVRCPLPPSLAAPLSLQLRLRLRILPILQVKEEEEVEVGVEVDRLLLHQHQSQATSASAWDATCQRVQALTIAPGNVRQDNVLMPLHQRQVFRPPETREEGWSCFERHLHRQQPSSVD